MTATIDLSSPLRMRTEGDVLCCPRCRGYCTHMENVQIAARREDDPFNEIKVNAVTGKIVTHDDSSAPAGEAVGEGRRQRIAIDCYCEICGGTFHLVFTQHKGVTHIEWVDATN